MEARTLVYVRTPQSVMGIRLISLDERHGITDKFKEFFKEPKRYLNSQFYYCLKLEEYRDNKPLNRPKNMKNRN